MSDSALIQGYVEKHLVVGENKFYRLLIFLSLNKLVLIENGTFKGTYPEIELMNIYDRLIILHRRNGDLNYLDTAKTFRRAAHKIYRIMLKKNMIDINQKFLNLV